MAAMLTNPAAYPFAGSGEVNLPPEFAKLRAAPGLTRVEMPHGGAAWLATRAQDVKALLIDRRFSRELANQPDQPRLTYEVLPPGSISALDGPDHSRVRRFVAAEFTKRRVSDYARKADEIAGELISRMTANPGPEDFVSAIAYSFPLLMICEIIGVPAEDRSRFEGLLSDLRSWHRPTSDSRSMLEDYMDELIELRMQREHHDLLGALVGAHKAGADLTRHELLNIGIALLAGGVGTPASFISTATYLLLEDTARWDELRSKPDRVAAILEELLRYIPIGVGGGKMRVASEDVELGGTMVKKGEAVLPVMTSADRDPDAFPDPDAINLFREPKQHFAFGMGTHRCLGSQLARMELLVLFSNLVRRLPYLRLAGTAEDVVWSAGDVVLGPRTLLVRW